MLGSKLKVLGLCTLALAVMAISAASAQAEKGAFWLVNATKISESLLPAIVGSLENEFGKLLSKIGPNEFHITCTKGELIKAHLVEPNGQVLGLVKFSGCKFFKLVAGVATELKVCEPHEGAEKGVVLTKEGKGLILLHKFKMTNGEELTEQVVDLEPKEGINFATITTGEECSFGEKITVGGITGGAPGKFVIKDCENKALTDVVTHLIEQNSLTELFVNGNKENKANIDGSALVKLGPGHEGLSWAAHS